MSEILNRLKNLENERPAVLRTADQVPSRSHRSPKKKSRLGVILFVAILISSAALAYRFKDRLFAQPEVAVATTIDFGQSPEQKNERAVASYQQGNFAQSLQEFQALVKEQPARAEFHVNLARAYQQLSQFDKAHDHLKLAVTLDANDSYAHNNLGLLALQTKEKELAEKSFTRAHELNPKSAEITFNLATYYEKTAQLQKAAETYQKYVSLPNADRAKVELLKKRIPRLYSLSAQGDTSEENAEGEEI